MRTLCLGEALVDLVCPRPVDGLVGADSFVPRFGGATANVAVTAARHGGNVALAGGAGDDAWGAWLRDRLASEGVGLEFFQLVAGAKTAVAFVTVDAGAQPSFQIYGESIQTVFAGVGDRLEAAVDACDALFLGSNTLVGADERTLTLRARERALAFDKPVVVDPNFRLHRWETATRAADTTRECVRQAFLVKCNREEARLLTGERDPEVAAASLLAAGAQHAIVTLGAEGAILRGGDIELDVGAATANPIDTTGAGDVFMGVVLARLTETGYYPPAIAAALPDAAAAAADATERWGALD